MMCGKKRLPFTSSNVREPAMKALKGAVPEEMLSESELALEGGKTVLFVCPKCGKGNFAMDRGGSFLPEA